MIRELSCTCEVSQDSKHLDRVLWCPERRPQRTHHLLVKGICQIEAAAAEVLLGIWGTSLMPLKVLKDLLLQIYVCSCWQLRHRNSECKGGAPPGSDFAVVVGCVQLSGSSRLLPAG